MQLEVCYEDRPKIADDHRYNLRKRKADPAEHPEAPNAFSNYHNLYTKYLETIWLNRETNSYKTNTLLQYNNTTQ